MNQYHLHQRSQIQAIQEEAGERAEPKEVLLLPIEVLTIETTSRRRYRGRGDEHQSIQKADSTSMWNNQDMGYYKVWGLSL